MGQGTRPHTHINAVHMLASVPFVYISFVVSIVTFSLISVIFLPRSKISVKLLWKFTRFVHCPFNQRTVQWPRAAIKSLIAFMIFKWWKCSASLLFRINFEFFFHFERNVCCTSVRRHFFHAITCANWTNKMNESMSWQASTCASLLFALLR